LSVHDSFWRREEEENRGGLKTEISAGGGGKSRLKEKIEKKGILILPVKDEGLW